jgi:hypothetical protein
MTIAFNSKVRVPEDVLVSQLNQESVLLNLKSETYFGLGDVGTRFWELLSSSDSIQNAYDVLLAEYDVDPQTLRNDMTELVEGLLQKGLLEIADA